MNVRAELRNLFAPGRGVAPPYLAGRERVLERMTQAIPQASGKPPPADVILIGPRGNGKTVLLGEFARRCRESGADVLDNVSPSQLASGAALAEWMLSPSSGSKLPRAAKLALKKIKSLTASVALKVSPVEASAQVGGARLPPATPTEAPLELTDLLLDICKARPRAVLLDEAHTLDLDVGQLLLNTAQIVNRKGAPFLLVLAGTPNLRDRLNAMDASFWDRSIRIGVGRLHPQATREALVKPLAKRGVSFVAEALEEVVEHSQQYPYFIQLWGDALCAALPADANSIDVDVVAQARPGFESSRRSYYGNRYEELRRKKLLPAARAVAKLYAHPPNAEIDNEYLEKCLRTTDVAPDEDEAARAVAELGRLGYIWTPPEDDRTEPGIPRLMTHVLAKQLRLGNGSGAAPENQTGR